MCGIRCLGPLTFHSQAVGSKVRLSQRGSLAERAEHSFKDGLVFSSRPVRVLEKVRLRVESCEPSWHGALRVGFTNVPPVGRTLPSMAIPDLTATPGHWAAPVPEPYCRAGSQLELWVSNGGNVYIRGRTGPGFKLLAGLDLSKPLWVMIDLYGQTSCVLLLGSTKKRFLGTQRSCPVPLSVGSHRGDEDLNVNQVSCIICCPVKQINREKSNQRDSHVSSPVCRQTFVSDRGEVCVVCLTQEASVTLLCGHRCVCFDCASRVIQEFGTCPLCRRDV